MEITESKKFENLLDDYISHDLFRKNMTLDYISSGSVTLEHMNIDIRNIQCDIENIWVVKSVLPGTNELFFAYIKIRGTKGPIISETSGIQEVSNFIGEYLGKNLIWIDI